MEDLMSAETQTPAPRPRPDWLSRAVVSGFVASAAMSVTFFLAYGLARVASTIELNPRRGAATFTEWMGALTNNQVLDLAATSLYSSAAMHLALGVVWAMLYAYAFEPRLAGPSWVRGVVFSGIPWILSLVVFLPAVGGGFFGANIGAGPLPAIGNLILHLAYGGTLGALYGPLGDIPADDFSAVAPADDPQVVASYEAATARGIVLGAAIGLVAGLAGIVVSALHPGALVLGVPGLAFLPVTAALGATFGALFGSIAGLTSAHAH
jgi:hypothetical protein